MVGVLLAWLSRRPRAGSARPANGWAPGQRHGCRSVSGSLTSVSRGLKQPGEPVHTGVVEERAVDTRAAGAHHPTVRRRSRSARRRLVAIGAAAVFAFIVAPIPRAPSCLGNDRIERFGVIGAV